MDERLSLVGLLLESVFDSMHRCTVRHDALALAAASLKARRSSLEAARDPLSALVSLEDSWRADAQEAPAAQQGAWADLLDLAARWHTCLPGGDAYQALRTLYQQAVADLQREVKQTQDHVGHQLDFLKAAFGPGTELSLAVNDLTVAPEAAAFLGQFLSLDYFDASRDLLLHRQEEQLLHEIDLTGLV